MTTLHHFTGSSDFRTYLNAKGETPYAGKIFLTAQSTRLYRMPNYEMSIGERLPTGTALMLLKEALIGNRVWFKVLYGDQMYWVAGKLVLAEEP